MCEKTLYFFNFAIKRFRWNRHAGPDKPFLDVETNYVLPATLHASRANCIFCFPGPTTADYKLNIDSEV